MAAKRLVVMNERSKTVTTLLMSFRCLFLHHPQDRSTATTTMRENPIGKVHTSVPFAANNTFTMSRAGHAQNKSSALPKKESILELSKLQDQLVRVKCLGGRELLGILRGYDELVNLVLDECDEFLRGKIFPRYGWQVAMR